MSEETGKQEPQVRVYYRVFWERYQELADWSKTIERIEKGEKKIERTQAIERNLKIKVARHKNPWHTLKINYGANKGKAFSEDEDVWLVCKMNEIGYGNWDELKVAVRNAWQFRFDWFIKSRTAGELQRRCETLTRLIEKENEELESKRKADEKAQKKSTPKSASKPAASKSGGGGKRKTDSSSASKSKKSKK